MAWWGGKQHTNSTPLLHVPVCLDKLYLRLMVFLNKWCIVHIHNALNMLSSYLLYSPLQVSILQSLVIIIFFFCIIIHYFWLILPNQYCMTSVSYTHLDVYKRQIWKSCMVLHTDIFNKYWEPMLIYVYIYNTILTCNTNYNSTH